MKKRIMSVCCTFLLIIGMLFISTNNAKAASDDPILDGSYLTHDEESVGYVTSFTRGVDLLASYSKCARLGPGKLFAGGTTIATRDVNSVRVTVLVERAKEGDTSWTYYDHWSKENVNADRVSSSRTLLVEGGYYYRVRCTHSAHLDLGSSFTNGVFIEKP
ncbi:hypothetical protein GN277_02140 [Lachnospiraceae bacterium WCA-9-b2]|uniref:Uncharacterized protein n=1 Tax=Sporofaciens musculi TaxID=2681861 RepID=A0A7X3MD70_9FIRM|nr:DUF6147 family protein [Sporofaciens musculi]MXP74264.1 hypothetical protein [Sporofaciens musculi]